MAEKKKPVNTQTGTSIPTGTGKKIAKKIVDKKEEKEKVEIEEEPKKEIEKEENAEKIKEKSEKESKPAVEKIKPKKEDKKEEKVEIERIYVIPLRKKFLKAPRHRRAKKAIKTIREFLVKHMRVENRDFKKIKIDRYLNNEIWFRGIKKPANKIKVKAVKKGGVVYVELVDIPEKVRLLMARDLKKLTAGLKIPKKKKEETPTEEKDKDKDGVEDKVEEKEERKSGEIREEKLQKVKVKEQKHIAEGKHMKKTSPVRKSLKK